MLIRNQATLFSFHFIVFTEAEMFKLSPLSWLIYGWLCVMKLSLWPERRMVYLGRVYEGLLGSACSFKIRLDSILFFNPMAINPRWFAPSKIKVTLKHDYNSTSRLKLSHGSPVWNHVHRLGFLAKSSVELILASFILVLSVYHYRITFIFRLSVVILVLV